MTGHSQIDKGISFIHDGMNEMSDNIQGTVVQPACKPEYIAEIKQLVLETQEILISGNYIKSLLELEIPKLSSMIELPGHQLMTMYSLHSNGPILGEVVCIGLKTVAEKMRIEHLNKELEPLVTVNSDEDGSNIGVLV